MNTNLDTVKSMSAEARPDDGVLHIEAVLAESEGTDTVEVNCDFPLSSILRLTRVIGQFVKDGHGNKLFVFEDDECDLTPFGQSFLGSLVSYEMHTIRLKNGKEFTDEEAICVCLSQRKALAKGYAHGILEHFAIAVD